MRLIIAKSGVKREIETPFSICCDMVDLEALIQKLQSLRDEEVAKGTTYGWLRVDFTPPPDIDLVTGPPLRWRE